VPKRKRCCSSRDRARASALVSLFFVALACDGKFAFDSAGTGGASTGGASTGGVSTGGGTAGLGGNSGSGNVSECEARCRSDQLTCLEFRQLCVECVEDSDCRAHGGGHCGVSGQVANRCVSCLTDEHCLSGEQCDTGTHSCVTSCARFDDPLCPATGPECNPFIGYCAACFDEDDCDDVRLMCSNGNARCVQCVDSDECASQTGKLCDPVLLLCVVCRDSEDCAPNQTCDPVAHICH
jgi:hypothetical protein